jgi:excisionase family DNA binding protein
VEAIELIRQMAGRFPDEQIAATLNRLGFATGANNTWSEQSVYSARHYHQLPAYDPNQSSHDFLTMAEAAQRLGISTTSVRRLIEQTKLTATQVVPCAPWQIPIAALESQDVRTAVANIKRGARSPQTQLDDRQQPMFSKD